MTLEELRMRCEEQGFQYAYGKFDEEVEPPHLVAITIEPNNFLADNKVYMKKEKIQLDYTYISKDIEMQNKIENEILSDVVWNKTEETYLSDEKIWQVSYFFEI